MLTQLKLKQILYYNPANGKFIWLNNQRRDLVGKVAGSVTAAGYVKIMVNHKQYKAHRLAWLYVLGEMPAEKIDHADRVKSNNIWANLRLASSRQNSWNTGKYKNNLTGFKGVTYKGNMYTAQATYEGQYLYLGSYESAELASEAYQTFSILAFGRFHADVLSVS